VPQQSASRSAGSAVRQGVEVASVLPPGIQIKRAPDHSRGFADPDAASTAAVVVSDSGTDDVYAYSLSGKLVATITGFSEPQGLGADLQGNIYVANTGDSNILIYKDDYATLEKTLNDPGQYPVDAAYDPTSQVTAVTNIISTSDGPGSVSMYARGSTSPCVTVSSSDFARVYFGAFDDKSQFFVDGENSSGAVVAGVVVGGCQAKTITTLPYSNTIDFPGGVTVTKTHEIAIDDQEGAAIYTYMPSMSSLGAPVATTPLTGASDPVTFSPTRLTATVWTADAGLAASNAYPYPTGGSPKKTVTGFEEPIGVVVTPVERP
jgi:hypothetical protein